MHRKEDDLYSYYNWQFLRRNPAYRAHYDQYVLALKTDESKAASMIYELHSRWGMSTFANYEDEMPEFLPNLFFEPITSLGLMSYDEIIASKNPITDLTGVRPGERSKRRFLLLAVDLENVRAKDYKSFQQRLVQIQSEAGLKATGEIKRITSKPEHLDVVLATYDEHKKNPSASNHELAVLLLTRYRTKENPDASQHAVKVGENIQRAEQLIALAPNILFDFTKIERD